MKVTAPAPSLRPIQAAEFLGVGISTFWRWTKRADFPKPRKLSSRCTIYDRGELLTWRDTQGEKAIA